MILDFLYDVGMGLMILPSAIANDSFPVRAPERMVYPEAYLQLIGLDVPTSVFVELSPNLKLSSTSMLKWKI